MVTTQTQIHLRGNRKETKREEEEKKKKKKKKEERHHNKVNEELTKYEKVELKHRNQPI